MDFKIKQNSELPILELKPYKGKNYSELLEIIKNVSVTFSMYDDKDFFIIKDKVGIINLNTKANNLNNKTDDCNDILDFTIQYHFTKKDTKKIGKYKGIFKIIFEQDGQFKTLITPYNKSLDIEVVKSNTKTEIIKPTDQLILDAIITGIPDEYISTNDNFYLKII
jgi:putative lipase involved disintegration of autophagic bodies